MSLKIIIGDNHDIDTYHFVNSILVHLNKYNMVDHLLLENAYGFVLRRRTQIEDRIKKKEYKIDDKYSPMVGRLQYQLGLDHELPIYGADIDIDKEVPDKGGSPTTFREKQMVRVITKHDHVFNTLTLVNDLHLRTIPTKEYGNESLVYTKFRFDPNAYIVRSNTREVDPTLPRGIYTRDMFLKLIHSDKFIKRYSRGVRRTKLR